MDIAEKFKYFIASILTRLFGGLDQIPYIFLNWVIENGGGGWAGVSTFYQGRKEMFYQRIDKTIVFGQYSIVAILLLIFIAFIWGDIPNSTGFIKGFFENIFADLIAGLIIAIIVKRYLERSRNRSLEVFASINHELKNNGRNNDVSIEIFIRNIGEEEYRNETIHFDILFDKNIQNPTVIDSIDFNLPLTSKEALEQTYEHFWSVSGFVSHPIFPTQTVLIAKLMEK